MCLHLYQSSEFITLIETKGVMVILITKWMKNQGTLQMPKILTGRLEMLLECFKLDTKCIDFNILYILDYIVSFL